MNEVRGNQTDMIRKVLQDTFAPTHLDIIDESYKHAGHAGAKDGGGHFIVHIQADAFTGLSRVQKHRLVNEATQHLFGSTIHALSIQARGPHE